jgi:PTS system nitrogen regulatory IIA component
MQLSLRDAARLLQVAERIIVKGVEQGQLRAERVHDQYRFHRAELLEWATTQRIAVAPDLMAPLMAPSMAASSEERAAVPGLADALATGGVHAAVPASDRESALRAVVDRLPLPPSADREFLVSVLLSRESLGSTGVGDGIAIPHVRNPIVLQVSRPLVSLCYLARPIDFGALDGQLVHTLFTLVSGTVKTHLLLLSRLAFALRDVAFRGVIARKGGTQEVVAAARALEARFGPNP